MKKVIISLLLLHCLLTSHSQHILNPYEDFTNQATSVPFPFVFNPQIQKQVFNSFLPGFGNGYTGEYMIAIREHPFSPFYNNALTYKIETVSFPFTLNCFNDPGNCAYPVLPEFERNMTMPDEPYDALRKVWGGSTNLKKVLFNVRENGEIELGAGYAGARWSGSDGIPDGLVSLSFYSSTPNFQDYLHPHTVLKHTVYLHCSSSYTSPVIDSIVWIYDNTRGRMRNYPFKNSNQPGGSAISHDVVFMPQVISKTEADHYYNEIENGTWYPGGTINYFPFDNQSWSTVCSANAAYFPPQDFEKFRYYDNSTNTYSDNYGYTAPFGLNACFLRDGNGSSPAGYKIDLLNTNNITIPFYHYGIKHNYYIDRPIDLVIINPDEGVIYNPSEVIVDPDAGDPQGNYDVQPGSDVTFEAGDVIHLTNGFQVSGGSFSAFTNTNIPVFPVCYDAQRLMPNQPKGKKQKPLADMQEFTLAPNPSSTGVFNIRFRNLPFNGEFSVFNAMGAEVKRIENIRQTNLTVSVEDLAKGIYMFRYREGSGYEIKKVVYE